MNQIAKAEDLPITGIVADIFEYSTFHDYDVILLDSMFHFEKKDRTRETNFIKTILSKIKDECVVIFCVHDTGNKVQILNETIDLKEGFKRIINLKFEYIFEDKATGHKSKTNYNMIAIKK